MTVASGAIISRITDGLGNQLFQYAAGRAVSLRSNLPLRLEPAGYSNRSLRSYRLGAYDLPARLASDADLAYCFTPFHQRRRVRALARRLNDLLPFRWRRLVAERTLRFDPRIVRIARPVYMSGFWQSERYFEDYGATIRRDLTLRTPIPACYRTILQRIDGLESLAVMVRRGDYLGIPDTQGICTLEYYTRALTMITARAPGRRVFVFSDDIPWCKSHLPVDTDATFVPSETPDAPEEDLRVLSHCRHFILANSTFAWWGAWLSTRGDGIVIGPSRWMQAADRWADILPSRWLRVPG